MASDWEASVLTAAGGAHRKAPVRIDMRELLTHSILILPRAAIASAIIFALMLALYVFVPTRYAAKAVMVVDPRLQTAGSDKIAPGIGNDSAALDSLPEVAVTDSFLLAIVKDQKLADDPDFAAKGGDIAVAAKLRSRLTVDRVGSTYVFEVTVKAANAGRAADLANAVASAIVSRVKADRGLVSDGAGKNLEEQVARLREAVAVSEHAAAAYRAKEGIVDAGRDANVAERGYSDLSRQYADAAAGLDAAKSRLDVLAQANGTGAGALDAIGSPLLVTLRSRRADLQQQVAELEGIFGPRHPQYTRARDRLTETDQLLASETRRLLTVARSDYDVAKKRVDSLKDKLAQAEMGVSGLDTASADLKSLELKAKADRDAYEAALSRLAKLADESAAPQTEIRVTSEALPPLEPTKKTLGFMFPVAAIAALPLGFMTMLAIALTMPRVRRPEEVEKLTDLPVVGTVSRSSWSARWPTRLVLPETSIDTAVGLLSEVHRRRRTAIILIAGASNKADTPSAAALLANRLQDDGIKAVSLDLKAGGAITRGSLRRLAFKAVGRDGLLLIATDGSDLGAEEARIVADLADVAILLVPWSAVSPRQLTLAAKRLAPNPQIPTMAMFAV